MHFLTPGFICTSQEIWRKDLVPIGSHGRWREEVLPGQGSHLTWESEVDSNWKNPKASNNFQRGGCYPELMYHSQENTAPKGLTGLRLIWGHCQMQARLWFMPGEKYLTPNGMQGDEPCVTSLLVGHGHPSSSLALHSRCSTHPAQHLLHTWYSLRMVRQTAWLQTANLFQESSSQPCKHGIRQAGGCKTSRPLLAKMKLIKDSINQPMINNFTSKAVAA